MSATEEVSSVRGEQSTKNAHQLSILITRQPPSQVFSDEWFDVGFDLSSAFPAGIPSDSIELCANIYHSHEGQYDSEPVKQNSEIDIHLATTSNQANGQNNVAIVKCKIKSPSIRAGKPIFYNIKFFQRIRQSGHVIENVKAAISTKVQIVAYKLSLECDWGIPVIFYKDEGGKDKHLKTIAKLYGCDGCIAKGTHVPLKVSLIYDNEEGSPVLKESDILRVLGSSKQYIDPENGQSIIKFRIEDVSKNHQGLQFKLLVSPVGSRSANVGDAVTPGISVRSKRNKRTLSPARKKTSHQLVGSPGSLFQSESGDSNIVASCLSTPKDLQHLKYHNQDMDIHVAMNHITEWTKEVTNTISTLNWTLIGYCQSADGTIDYSKPNHLMPYPNDCIKKIMNSYSTNIHQCLEVLRKGIEKGLLQSGRAGGETDTRSFAKTSDSSLRSPPSMLSRTNNQDPKHNYRDYPIPSNFLPTPITPMSPVIGHPSALSQANHSDSDRKRPIHQPEIVWNKNKRTNHDVPDNNEHLKRIEYVLAKHFRSPNGDLLGFPVCDVNKELLGFFRESDVGEGNFFPIPSDDDFDAKQSADVKRILEEAITQRSDAVHRLRDCGSIASLFDHAMVYDWSREFSQHT